MPQPAYPLIDLGGDVPRVDLGIAPPLTSEEEVAAAVLSLPKERCVEREPGAESQGHHGVSLLQRATREQALKDQKHGS